jgi:putative transposase
MGALQLVSILLQLLLQSRAALAAENLALRQQVAVLQRSVKRPRLDRRDRIFWVWLSRLWRGWRSTLIVIQPETVIRWHRPGFRLYWRWRSRGRCGRPKLDAEIRALIRRMSRDNPTWGRRRIRSEPHLLGYEVGELTVAKYMVRGRKPPSQGWRVFLNNHSRETAAIDFFTVPTVNFRILIYFLVLHHHRRTVIHFNVTSHPTQRWTAQQIVEAFPYDTAPRYVLRDRDRIYGSYFGNRVRGMGIEEVLIAPRSPRQSPFVERLIGSIRRECLDHVLVINEAHLRRVLREYFTYIPRVTAPPVPRWQRSPAARDRATESGADRGRAPGRWSPPPISTRRASSGSLRVSGSATTRPVGQRSNQRSGRKACRRIRIAGWFSVLRPIARQLACLASHRDDLLDRHSSSLTWYSKGSSEREKILEQIAEAFLDEVPANLYDRRRGFAARVRRNSF